MLQPFVLIPMAVRDILAVLGYVLTLRHQALVTAADVLPVGLNKMEPAWMSMAVSTIVAVTAPVTRFLPRE